ncbi:MAG: tRNA (adenosine(37)-N6)-threonylcarbamoyltransferase complex ATPase subunit type 1 TsaE [Candidatus Kapabacteria bacterium]|nr:tRNA (adenosine(37)-N6)-threonylcarbamoyltransferase complex ATPase subunit type 1 TsaE [Ignavibacteriota bacterium]MCW5884358.1 tRNA (adenosine(37)-N6)-threonylcarbamoyltransferase complex ATPase subunit type 1 TsaE [Candidatus Kapabacteria bacterium]
MDKIITGSENETILAGINFARGLNQGNIIALTGELGAGKTEFVKGICEFYGVEEIVTSPTFTIINSYEGFKSSGSFMIYHIDLYRINDQQELKEIGFEECLSDDTSIKLIEWAEKAEDRLREIDYLIEIKTDEYDENKREILIKKC